jgi:SAM-dependent methyltransferase
MASAPRKKKPVCTDTSPTPLRSDEDLYAHVASFYDALMYSIPYADWVDYVERLWRIHSVTPRRVLDLACGTGTVSILLAKRGYQVVGVDRSEPMLAEARRKAAAAGVDIQFYCQNAAELKLKDKFDACICLYDSLNYILDDESLLAAFRGVRRSLRPEGMFLFDLNSLYSFQMELFSQASSPGATVGYDWHSHFDPTCRVADIQMHFEPPNGAPFDIVHYERAYLVEEILSLLRKARFRLVEMYDAYSLLPPGRYSERIFYLAQKPMTGARHVGR